MPPNPTPWQALRFPSTETYTFPNIVNVEVFRGKCPCNCRHCPVGNVEPAARETRFGSMAIDLDLFDRITKEIGRHHWSAARLHSVGDPILWNELPKALQIAAENGARPWVFTSAVTSNEAMLDALSRHGTIVEVSVNSTHAADYRETKGIDAFDLVVENIRHMRKNASGGVRLLASRVQSQDRAADEEFKRYWKASGLVDDAFVRSYHTYNEAIAELDPGLAKSPHQACLVHWARFNIDVRGRAVVCFNELFKSELDDSLVYGDVNTTTIAEIWHGPKLTALRKAELSGNYEELSWAGRLPCKNCTSCQPLLTTGQTSEHQLDQLDSPTADPPSDHSA